MHATHYQNGRVFCMGDAVHRHPPSNGLGSNTSIQDAFNLAWKLALVLKGQAAPRCSTATRAERAPIGKQIVDRANQSIERVRPDLRRARPARQHRSGVMKANMEARKEDTPRRRRQRGGSCARRSPSRSTSSTRMASR